MANPLTFGPGIEIGLGINLGPGVIVVDFEYLTTEDGFELITENGDFLITE